MGGLTENVALKPVCPLPSSALRYMLVAAWDTAMLPVQVPLTKLPDLVGETGIGRGPENGTVSPELTDPILRGAATQSALKFWSVVPMRW